MAVVEVPAAASRRLHYHDVDGPDAPLLTRHRPGGFCRMAPWMIRRHAPSGRTGRLRRRDRVVSSGVAPHGWTVADVCCTCLPTRYVARHRGARVRREVAADPRPAARRMGRSVRRPRTSRSIDQRLGGQHHQPGRRLASASDARSAGAGAGCPDPATRGHRDLDPHRRRGRGLRSPTTAHRAPLAHRRLTWRTVPYALARPDHRSGPIVFSS